MKFTSIRPAWLTAALLSLAALTAAAQSGKTGDWPGWRGPDRTGISRETGLLKSWPDGGPKLRWKAEGLGGGYSTPSVARGRAFGMGYVGETETVWALDTRTGRQAWSATVAAANHRIGYGEGSRSTPTIDGNRLYALGVSGDLVCLDNRNGKLIWRRNLPREFGGSIPGWGYTESPLIDGNKVIVTPGRQQATMVALDKMTGQLIWKSQVPGGDPAQYASSIVATVDGVRQYIQFLRGGVVGVAADDGRFLWRYSNPANGTANCSTPIFQDNHLFAASGYGVGGGLVKLTKTGDGVSATEVYFTRQMRNHHGGMILIGGYLYGFDGGTLTCLNFKTGKIAWTNRSVGKGSLVYADGHLYARAERGAVALVEANPKEYVEKGQFQQPFRSGKNAWAHPVVANGRLYLRDQDILLCYDIKKSAQ